MRKAFDLRCFRLYKNKGVNFEPELFCTRLARVASPQNGVSMGVVAASKECFDVPKMVGPLPFPALFQKCCVAKMDLLAAISCYEQTADSSNHPALGVSAKD